MELFGRRVIYTDQKTITEDNIREVLEKALSVHNLNRGEIQYLYEYYKGKQPILQRVKDIRPEICNKIVENRANEIVSFKVGYLMGEPVQYVNRSGEDNGEALNTLNEYVFSEDKEAKDKELADWFTICGTAYRMILPDDTAEELDEAPFELYTLDPRNTFVVRYSGLGNRVLMGVMEVKRDDLSTLYCAYTDTMYYEIEDTGAIRSMPHALGRVPIIEYPANTARLGAFEIVITMLDAINEVESNRLDGVEQFVQAFLKFIGIDVESEDYKALKDEGAIVLPEGGDMDYVAQELNQTQTQTLVDHLYQTVLTICGMPNRNGGTSTSDTGSAVIMRDGWSAAEARAKDTELMFKRSEKDFLRLALHICNTVRHLDLKLSGIEIRFTRRNYENIQMKSQVLTTMLSNSKIHPRLAFAHCGMFVDPELAYEMSMKYAEEERAKALALLETDPEDEEDGGEV